MSNVIQSSDKNTALIEWQRADLFGCEGYNASNPSRSSGKWAVKI
jgi:hypothetical protein